MVPLRQLQVSLAFPRVAPQADDAISYGAAMVGVATAKTPCGPYTYKGSFKPLGADSRDESIFQDSESSRAAHSVPHTDGHPVSLR